MNYKEYVGKRFGLVMTDSEVKELERYLLQNANKIENMAELKKYIGYFIANKFKGRPLRVIAEADNSDLEQMLKLLKAKADNK